MDISNRRAVLIVEDIEEISTGLRQVLNRHGHRVMRASDAAEAMQIAEQDRPAMILTDMELPTFDLLMKLLREHERFSQMVVAIVDMNSPQIADTSVKVLSDYNALDALMISISHQPVSAD